MDRLKAWAPAILLFAALVATNLYLNRPPDPAKHAPYPKAYASDEVTETLRVLVSASTVRVDMPTDAEKRYRRCFQKGIAYEIDKSTPWEEVLQQIRQALKSKPLSVASEIGDWEEIRFPGSEGVSFLKKGSPISPEWRLLAKASKKESGQVEDLLIQTHPKRWILLELHLSC